MSNCRICGRPLRPASRGRPPEYCSRACRARAYRMRLADAPAAAAPLRTDDATASPPGPGRSPNAAQAKGRRPDPREGQGQGLSLERIVHGAMAIADRNGVAELSMRRTAAELGVGTMSLYRYVSGKEDLVDHMVDAIFGAHPLPEPGPDGWRAKLELSARREWGIYQEHPWAAPLVATTTRPPIAPNMIAYTDWRMRAVDGRGLDFPAMVQVAITISTFLQGAALYRAHETAASRGGRRTREQWLESRQGAIAAVMDTGRFPMVSRFGDDAYRASEPDSLFTFGLDRVLDGVAALLGDPPGPSTVPDPTGPEPGPGGPA